MFSNITRHLLRVPSYLHGHPHTVIVYCLNRKAKGNKYTPDDVTAVGNGVFEVIKPSGRKHTQ